ncbi:hypothetical protein CDCA_CDCA07G2091 [Cyanidium caldarium]|uniref:GNAT family N-acetyltransferase n=1 Tax=Cyanidium caldarium TaxID=2771 RepID=A0AAV9IVI6_CYACA|nr:hypothetical protein CDCA_CDCA07G2091 [Cyanidium caldarium]
MEGAFVAATIRCPVGSRKHGQLAVCSRARWAQPGVRRWTSWRLMAEDSRAKDPNWSKAIGVGESLHMEHLGAVSDVSRETWNALVREEDPPFVEYDFLRCLEDTGCAVASRGWLPHHLMVRRAEARGELVAAVPCYIKMHSLGEFVFDHDWAEVAERAGVHYYPKLLCGVPFTPVAGRRILTGHADAAAREAILGQVARHLERLVRTPGRGLSSVHVNFLEADEVDAFTRHAAFFERRGVQYHFQNDGRRFRTFDEFLAAFPSKKRIQIRRERRAVREEQDVQIEVVRGDEAAAPLYDTMFDIYKSTVDKFWFGRQYLNRQFFQWLRDRAPPAFQRHLCFVVARDARGEVIAGTVNFFKAGRFFGRYWGALPGTAGENMRFLHFEVCYYAAVEHCITCGGTRMEPGAGGGEFKCARGFDAVVTRSVHLLGDPRLHQVLKMYTEQEREYVSSCVDELAESSYLKSRNGSGA